VAPAVWNGLHGSRRILSPKIKLIISNATLKLGFSQVRSYFPLVLVLALLATVRLSAIPFSFSAYITYRILLTFIYV